jgi:predicted ATPase/class 3 adenylate cyclase
VNQSGNDIQRELVGIMFTDIKGYSAKMDENEAAAYQMLLVHNKMLLPIVENFKGELIKTVGDSLIVSFRSIVSAVQCGVEMQVAIHDHNLNAPDDLKFDVRIGINLGDVIITANSDFFGQDVNLAARLESSGIIGSVVVPEVVQKLVSGKIKNQWIELGEFKFKNIEAPQQVFRVLMPWEEQSTFQTSKNIQFQYSTNDLNIAMDMMPLVGRKKEFELLIKSIDDLQDGKGQLVFIAGEAGIGKTRLAEEILIEAGTRNIPHLIGRCLFTGGLPLHPFYEIIDTYFKTLGVRERITLEKTIKQNFPELTARIPIIANFLNLQVDQDPNLLSKEQLWDTLRKLFQSMTQAGPIIFLLDDVHWVDEVTTNFLAFLTTSINRFPLLILGTYRPEDLITDGKKQHPFEFALQNLSRTGSFKKIELPRLNINEIQDLLDTLFEHAAFTSRIAQILFRQTQGNPYYIHELIHIYQDEGYIEKNLDNKWEITVEDPNKIELPSTIVDLVERRLQRLDQRDKEILEIAAVEGFKFHSSTISSIINLDKIETLKLIQNIQKCHQLIKSLGKIYEFQHLQIREVIYNSIPEELREEYHRLIANLLIEQFNDDTSLSGLISYHLLKSNNAEKAIPYLLVAGLKTISLHAFEEALPYFTQAEELIKTYSQPDIETEYSLYINLVEIYSNTGNREAQFKSLQRLQELAETAQDDGKLVDVYTSWSGYYRMVNNYYDAEEYGLKAVGLAEKFGHDDKKAIAYFTLARLFFHQGLFAKASQFAQNALAIYTASSNYLKQADVLNTIGNIHFTIGNMDEAANTYNEALKLVKRAQDRHLEAKIHGNIGLVLSRTQNNKQALEPIENCLELSREIGDRNSEARAINSCAFIYWSLSDYEKALLHYQQALEIREEIGDRRGMAYGLVNMGFLSRAIGNNENSQTYFRQALQIGEDLNLQTDVIVQCCLGLADNLLDSDDDKEINGSIEFSNRALTILKQVAVKTYIAFNLSNLAWAYYKLDALDKACEFSREAIEIIETNYSLDPHNRRVFYVHSKILARQGNDNEAMFYLKRAYDEVMEQAKSITDEKILNTYLSLSPENQTIIKDWELSHTNQPEVSS